MARSTRRRRRTTPEEFSKEILLQYVRSHPEQAIGFRHMLEDFGADAPGRRQIKDLLDQLVKDGKLIRHKGNRYEAQPELTLCHGRISLHADGYGFVTPDQRLAGVTGDIFIPPPSVGSAMHGDRVAVALVSKKDAEGKVVRVEQRARQTLVGQVRYDGQVYFLSPADDRLPEKILVSGEVSEHKDKIVEVELTRFPSETGWPAGRIVSVIGFLDDPGVETTVIMKKYGLAAEFPEPVEQEAARRSIELTPDDMAGREDFRGREIVTIDPPTARDFDDAVDVEQRPDGSFQIGVHVADVAHFVLPGSAIDKEARARGCSVYFPDRVVPMLPERLSNQICSLNPRADRLAMSVILEIGLDGDVTVQSVHNSIIRSQARLNYETVQRIIDGDGPARKRHHHIVGLIETLERAARILRQRRIRRGTIDFDLPEPELTYDREGLVQGIVKAERYISHRIVEELMIAANEAVARLLESQLGATIFRIHEPPDPVRVGELAETLSALGLPFRTKHLTPAAFQQFLASIAGRPDERMVSFIVLRSFRQALYSTRNRGHFGLASPSYTHFTSPIRRYPDLVIHRLLKAYLAGKRRAEYSVAELETIAAGSSARERASDAAERDLFDWKRMILLEEHLGDTLDAIVISVFGKGVRVELVDYFIEGFIGVDDMTDDYYDFDPRSRSLIGRGTRRKYRLGQEMAVRVARIDKLLGRAYFLPVEPDRPADRPSGPRAAR